MKIGIDIGGVVIAKSDDRCDTSFLGSNFLLSPAVEGAFQSIAQLNSLWGYRCVIISKCGPSFQSRTLQWLAHHDFYQITGVAKEDVHFCLRRTDKAPICRALGVTHFVDDRLDVLDSMLDVPHRYLFQPNAKDEGRWWKWHLHGSPIHLCRNWKEVLRLTLRIGRGHLSTKSLTCHGHGGFGMMNTIRLTVPPQTRLSLEHKDLQLRTEFTRCLRCQEAQR